MGLWQGARDFVVRHKRGFLIALLVYVAAIVLLVVLSSGPQQEPFLYQIN